MSWLGRRDLNARIQESKSRALPLGYAPATFPAQAHLATWNEVGWIVGLEPTTSRATIWHSNQLNYIHHVALVAYALPAESDG